ncbi:MAG: hypothetical protein ACRCV9_13850 [Burkholderiaceae bacterium]
MPQHAFFDLIGGEFLAVNFDLRRAARNTFSISFIVLSVVYVFAICI